PDKYFDVLARTNHGGGRRWLCLFGGARGSRRNVEAWEKTCADKFLGRCGAYWDPQRRLEGTFVTLSTFCYAAATRDSSAQDDHAANFSAYLARKIFLLEIRRQMLA